MKLSKVSKSLLVMCLAALFPIVMARSFCQDIENREKAYEERFNEIVKELNLSAEQQQQMATERDAEKAVSQELREKMKVLRGQLSEELDRETTDQARVRVLIGQMKELIGQRMEKKIEGVLAMKRVLTPEQFKMLQEKTKKSGKRGGRP